jgi:hypothetical protein
MSDNIADVILLSVYYLHVEQGHVSQYSDGLMAERPGF